MASTRRGHDRLHMLHGRCSNASRAMLLLLEAVLGLRSCLLVVMQWLALVTHANIQADLLNARWNISLCKAACSSLGRQHLVTAEVWARVAAMSSFSSVTGRVMASKAAA